MGRTPPRRPDRDFLKNLSRLTRYTGGSFFRLPHLVGGPGAAHIDALIEALMR